MDRTDLTRTGCSAPLFAMPPKSSAAYRPSGEGGQIIPFGWTYRIRSVSDGMEFTSVVEGASEVADAFSKMQGPDWSGSFAGFKIESTQSASQTEQTRQLLENRSMAAVTKVATVGPPALQAYRLDLEKVACRVDATACDSLMRVGALVVYGKARHGGNVDLTPAQSVPLSTLAQPPAAAKPGVGDLLASPALPVLFVVDPGADDIDGIGMSVAQSADPRIGQPTEEGCCGTLAMSPTLCRVKTGERRDCVPIGNSVSCGDYMPFLEDMACPARPLSGADGESHLEWELVHAP